MGVCRVAVHNGVAAIRGVGARIVVRPTGRQVVDGRSRGGGASHPVEVLYKGQSRNNAASGGSRYRDSSTSVSTAIGAN